MIRLRIPALFVLSIATIVGCQGQDAQVPMDPFYGQTKIAPPATGEITRRSTVDPYYPRSAAASPASGTFQSPPSISGAPVEAEPAARLASNSAAPPGQETAPRPGDHIDIPVSARRELSPEELLAAAQPRSGTEPPRSAGAVSSVTALGGTPEEPRRVVQTLAPRDQSFAGQSTGRASRSQGAETMSSRSSPVDINDLPPVNRGAGTVRDDRVQLASATDAGSGIAVRIPTRVDEGAATGRYGWADDYTRLRGQLEYLEADRCWKLRYIPIDRESDDFGGSVLIKDSASLSGFERGNFVEIRGQISKRPEDGTDFAPVYEVTSIRRL